MKRIIILLMSFYIVTAQAKECDDCPLKNIIPGQYTVIGRLPDSERTYSSQIEIKALKNKTFSAIEKINGKMIRRWEGQFKHASPGEGYVLHLKGQQGELACLVSADLDNYARMTCLWKKNNQQSNKFGLVALFPKIDQ